MCIVPWPVCLKTVPRLLPQWLGYGYLRIYRLHIIHLMSDSEGNHRLSNSIPWCIFPEASRNIAVMADSIVIQGRFSRQLFSHSISSKVRKLHYFVIWHDFSDLQWLKSEVSAQKHLFSRFQVVFPSQSVQWPTTRSWIFKIFWNICWNLRNVDVTPAKWSPEYCTG